jgi:hypothetical protein
MADTAGGAEYGTMTEELRMFLDAVAAAAPGAATITELEMDLRACKQRLAPLTVAERAQIFARRLDLPGRGQTMSPKFEVVSGDENRVHGTVTFGRYYLGGGGAVLGGAIPPLFDEVLGRLANFGGRRPARTAHLRTDFRSITPVEQRLDISAWFVREERRKRILASSEARKATALAMSSGWSIWIGSAF